MFVYGLAVYLVQDDVGWEGKIRAEYFAWELGKIFFKIYVGNRPCFVCILLSLYMDFELTAFYFIEFLLADPGIRS